MGDLRVRVQPRARVTEVAGERAGAVLVRLKAPPVDGKANAELVAFVAARANVPRRSVEIVRGHGGRDKVVRVDGVSAAELRRAMLSPG